MNWHQTHTAAKHLSMRENVAVTTAGSELHASPHIHIWIATSFPGEREKALGTRLIWIGHTHIWIYMDKTIWENALYVG